MLWPQNLYVISMGFMQRRSMLLQLYCKSMNWHIPPFFFPYVCVFLFSSYFFSIFPPPLSLFFSSFSSFISFFLQLNPFFLHYFSLSSTVAKTHMLSCKKSCIHIGWGKSKEKGQKCDISFETCCIWTSVSSVFIWDFVPHHSLIKMCAVKQMWQNQWQY